jgi:hypothetical protein
LIEKYEANWFIRGNVENIFKLRKKRETKKKITNFQTAPMAIPSRNTSVISHWPNITASD